uniref:Uncharacterized protein n=1 Tax=Kwoniella bestiolae CBS 10118 TaxID=1296100 RepID=A0A1B9FYS3_9TREE|nr:hypothetical protein I302_06896 [Kwoniella bestiolae CBS 10118]OCF23910.1 hypothetical protein I302_06896 [Kwoniella bestiolae CBS 10118]
MTKPQKANVRFHSPPQSQSHPTTDTRRKCPISPPPPGRKKRPNHSLLLLLPKQIEFEQRNMNKPLDHTKYWNDYYSSPSIGEDEKLPKPPSKIKLYSTKWKLENPNPKCKPPSSSVDGEQAFYGNPMMMGYGGGMGMGMYPGMGVGPMGMGYGMGGGMGMMGYGMPRYGGAGTLKITFPIKNSRLLSAITKSINDNISPSDHG